MTIVRKQLLAPTVVFTEDEQGNAVPVEFTKRHIEHYFNSGRQMLRAGLPIPVPQEHQDSKPVRAADRRANQVKNNAGWVHDFVRGKNGSMYVDLDIDETKIKVSDLPKTIKYCSPEISPGFVDPKTGHRWNNVITHVALTTRPRWIDQEPFASAGGDGAKSL